MGVSNDPETIALIYLKLGKMGDNGGFDPATVEALKREYPGYVSMIDAFMRSLSATRLGNLMSGQVLMGLKQNDFDTRLCAVEETTNKTMNYVAKLVNTFEVERDEIIGKQREHEERQREHEERMAKREARRDQLLIGFVLPIVAALIKLAEVIL